MKTRVEFKIHYGDDEVNSMEQYEPEEEKEETEGPGGLVEDTNEEINNDELEESNSHGDIRETDWDEETFNVCKEKMLPMKPML